MWNYTPLRGRCWVRLRVGRSRVHLVRFLWTLTAVLWGLTWSPPCCWCWGLLTDHGHEEMASSLCLPAILVHELVKEADRPPSDASPPQPLPQRQRLALACQPRT